MRELKWQPEQAVELSVLGEGGRAGTARILELSGKRMRVEAAPAVPPGAAVRLEWDGQLVLGEVLDAAPAGFWIEIQHMLLAAGGLNWQKQGWQR
jgi:hypothetical protein